MKIYQMFLKSLKKLLTIFRLSFIILQGCEFRAVAGFLKQQAAL